MQCIASVAIVETSQLVVVRTQKSASLDRFHIPDGAVKEHDLLDRMTVAFIEVVLYGQCFAGIANRQHQVVAHLPAVDGPHAFQAHFVRC